MIMFGLLKRNAKYIVGNVRSESTDNTNRALIIDAINNSLCIPQSGFNKGKRDGSRWCLQLEMCHDTQYAIIRAEEEKQKRILFSELTEEDKGWIFAINDFVSDRQDAYKKEY